eukprot:jgi/Undpi1/4234/HiC_scaffold_16.g07600.m1
MTKDPPTSRAASPTTPCFSRIMSVQVFASVYSSPSLSLTDEGSLQVGETATDACECGNNLLADGTLLCADDANSVRGGRPADDACECVVNRYDEGTGLCGCNNDVNCRGSKCCMDGNICSDEDELSVGSGDAADDVCECSSGVFDDTLGLCGCTLDSECDTGIGEICCPDKNQCEIPLASDPTACGDPHMTGFHGQKFDFTGEDGAWYALISDLPSVHVNMRVTAPVPSLPEITYITGLSVLTTDSVGDEHSIVISVKNPHSLDSACQTEGSVCLADGALSVVIDGEEELIAPGTTVLAPGVEVSAVNIPGECRSFGFEQYWERKKLEYAQADRRLFEAENMGDWILGDPTVTNMAECIEYVTGALMDGNALFDHQSEHASFRIITPAATIRLSHGRLHQLPMRDPTDQYDLPDHLTWQMNMAIDHSTISEHAQGVIGETIVPTRDTNGDMIMHGMECIRGQEEDYYVEGPLGVSFAQATLDY